MAMNKYEVVVSLVGENVDLGETVDGIREHLASVIPAEVFANVKPNGVVALSEQGFKVWRARVVGISAEQAGDAHNPKASKAEATA